MSPKVFSLCILGGYLLLINLITFAIRGRDKRQATKQKRRVSEKTLLTLSLCGGRIGAIVAIETFRHKTIKSSFLWKFYLIGGGRIAGLVLILYSIS